MKGKHRVSPAHPLPRMAIFAFLICAIFLTTFRSANAPVSAQTGEAGQPGSVTYDFSNNSPIEIRAGGPANPYPSTIEVSNIPIQLAKVTVRINSFNHTVPQDVDIMVVGPQGQTCIIMSDAGGFVPAGNTTIVFDDDAPTLVPSPLTGGTFKPTNLQTGDNFPAPAPPPAGNPPLSIFSGTNPNGTWRLFVVDDVELDAGLIGLGWTLSITPAISGENTNAISIPASGMASPYPSEINISNINDPLARVLVTLNNFSHSSPDDVDILLVSPSGRAVVLMSDVGGTNSVSNLNIVFDDFSQSALPDSTALTSGIFRPTDSEPGETFPAPAPSGITIGRTLASLNGTTANGVWRLFVVDDSGNNVGNISGGWNVLLGTYPGTIRMQGAGIATPYPSEIAVSGFPGLITRASVAINNFSHLAPDDVDILLVGPDGRRIVLMSDAGGSVEAGGLDLIFDDDAQSALPDSGPLTTGTFRPSDYEPGESFPAPAPPPPHTGNTLGAFYGGTPNGTWRLFVVSDSGSGFGSIAGTWSLTLETSVNACPVGISPVVQAFPVGGGSGSINITQSVGCTWNASTTDSFISITSGSSGGGNGVVSFSVAPNPGPARTGTIEVTNGFATRTFQIQQASGCPFSVGQSTVNFPYTGGVGNVSITAGGECGWQGSTAASWIQITSSPQSGNGTLSFTVQPHPSRAARSATINVGVQVITVNQAGTRTAPFDFDGDRRTDVSVYRPSNGSWWIANSSGGVLAKQFGLSTDRTVAADYDGDLKSDIAIYREGTWYVIRSSDDTIAINGWGTTGDIPVPADYNADGLAEFAVYRPSTGTWWLLNANGMFNSAAFGIATDIPTPADYDGDGRADLSVYRGGTSPGAAGTWWILNSSNGTVSTHTFGVQGDIPVPADYDSDGRDNVAVYRPSTSTWYRSTNPATNYDAAQWGLTGDVAAPGDYDGDGRVDPAVVRIGSSAVWYMLGSASGPQAVQFGVAGDRAVPGVSLP